MVKVPSILIGGEDNAMVAFQSNFR
jgi:hypothetical protein